MKESKINFCIFREPYEPKPVIGAALSLVGGHSSIMDVVEIELQNKVSL